MSHQHWTGILKLSHQLHFHFTRGLSCPCMVWTLLGLWALWPVGPSERMALNTQLLCWNQLALPKPCPGLAIFSPIVEVMAFKQKKRCPKDRVTEGGGVLVLAACRSCCLSPTFLLLPRQWLRPRPLPREPRFQPLSTTAYFILNPTLFLPLTTIPSHPNCDLCPTRESRQMLVGEDEAFPGSFRSVPFQAWTPSPSCSGEN